MYCLFANVCSNALEVLLMNPHYYRSAMPQSLISRCLFNFPYYRFKYLFNAEERNNKTKCNVKLTQYCSSLYRVSSHMSCVCVWAYA